MPLSDLIDHAGLMVVTFIAAAINSVAGGGTLLTFPILAAILPAGDARLVVANATSTVGLWPGAVAAAWAYRGERRGQPPWAVWLIAPSVLGAVAGGLLLVRMPSGVFDRLVPWLILAAAILFAIQPAIARLAFAERPTRRSVAAACGVQFLVSVYGGYFGAGIGILMLAMLGCLGLGDIHRLNGVKNVLGTIVNGASASLFIVGSLAGWHDISWPHALTMAVAAVAGGLAGSSITRQMAPHVVRRIVSAIGFTLAAYYLVFA
ncbi:MAG: sulfite exporter TauE/SafE family protein [Planctomycetaceae bacterium]